VPVYEYACTECGEELEVRQSFTDAALTVCPVCSGRLRKVLSPVGVVFKGSGFYRTDSRAAESGSNGKSSDAGADGSGDKQGKSDKDATAGKAAKADSGTSANGSGSGSGSGSGKDATGSSKPSSSSTPSSTAKAGSR
jgi:putative FmdB family regulatory protein